MTLPDRIARIESTGDAAVRVHLEAIERELDRVEARVLRVAQRRSSWTRIGELALILEDDPA